jgi:serine/threonine protein kinase
MNPADDERTSIPRIGEVLAGKYEVQRVLGAGAMGVVVAARHRLLGQTVAIKLIAGSRESRSNAVVRFTREARAVAALASDHVVRILDFGLLDDGRPFMVMQHLVGRDLTAEVRARGGKLRQVDAVDYVIQACAGLAVAHASGIVHRDIKPTNLLLTKRANGEPLVVIVDFGISKTPKESEEELSLTASQTTLGSPLYMSPEQIRDAKAVDARTDIWALGVVLRFLLTGKPAFTARDASGVLAAVIADEPAPLRTDAPEVSAGLEQVVARCLEKKAAFRYGSSRELAQALAPYASASGRALASTIANAAAIAPPVHLSSEVALSMDDLQPGTFASTTRGASAPPIEMRARWRAALGLALTTGSVAVAAAIALRVVHPRREEPAVVAPREAVSMAMPPPPPVIAAAVRPPAPPPSASTDAAVLAPPVRAPTAGARSPRTRPTPDAAPPPDAPSEVRASDPLDTAK